MTERWTPGPWFVRGFHIWQELHRDKTSRGRIADATLAWRGSEETDANAHLIAAAPEMAEALDRVEAVMSIVPPRGKMAEYLETLAQVRAALAKARGESHD